MEQQTSPNSHTSHCGCAWKGKRVSCFIGCWVFGWAVALCCICTSSVCKLIAACLRFVMIDNSCFFCVLFTNECHWWLRSFFLRWNTRARSIRIDTRESHREKHTQKSECVLHTEYRSQHETRCNVQLLLYVRRSFSLITGTSTHMGMFCNVNRCIPHVLLNSLHNNTHFLCVCTTFLFNIDLCRLSACCSRVQFARLQSTDKAIRRRATFADNYNRGVLLLSSTLVNRGPR